MLYKVIAVVGAQLFVLVRKKINKIIKVLVTLKKS